MFKIKKLCAVILAIFVIGLGSIIYVSGRKQVPKLTVTYNGLNVPVGQGPYRWKSRGKLKMHEIDSYADVLSKLSPIMKVPPDGKLKLKFDYQPETITLDGENNNDGKMIKDNVINISEYGTGLYFLECKWKEGNVTYLIYVDINLMN
ncbi:hypothetical protein IRP63_04525 [Clostridium botulinum]|uniref:hypothetical protein n=1 Tax=Clostridium botulinum TaxID=1491 RepID=UPI0004D730E4|nr:hypothetical protein [Clostridium botulinum]KEI00849.1 hypothetical protein Z952_13825 [Clostridium botulinum C/D str. BKT75002]KEI09163.1 hypothetical protein Z954_13565 [Clostridium botulinum C/D str. BKT2873]KGM96208.1 hypothetical protein Z956_03345 [Clostridium botulinum D str. CCUG 7971]KOC46235.1 hypothetical protein ADU88_12380 [Clostridium botulinum]MCD3234704.1 hypothetical protein [Clostridium botulinum D/C]